MTTVSRRKFLQGMVVAGVGLGFTACSTGTLPVPVAATPTSAPQSQTPQPQSGGSLVIFDADANQPLDPFFSGYHTWPHYAIFSTLVKKDMNQQYVGYLADTWDISDDGMTVKVNLIRNAKFTDGTPVDAQAVQWNLLRYADKNTGAMWGGDLVGLVTGVDVDDDYSFTMHLASPFAPLLYDLSLLEIVSPTAYQKWGKTDFGTHPVGSGPFMLKELNTNNYIVMERNPDFQWAPKGIYTNQGPVYLDQLVVKFITEEQTKLAALETGEATYSAIPNQNVEEVKANPDIDVHMTLEQGIRYLGFNTQKPPYDNPALRKALAYAVNRDDIVTLAYDGLAQPAYGVLPPSIWGYYPEIKADCPPYDPAQAMQALDDLGYKDVDGDGYREDPQGNQWTITLMSGVDDVFKRTDQVLESQFKAVGVKILVETLGGTGVGDATKAGTHEMIVMRYEYAEPSILTYFFDPKRIGASNRARYDNPDLAALLVKADTDMNPQTRLETIKEIQQFIDRELPWIPLVYTTGAIGIRKELKNWDFTPEGEFLYWNSYFES